MRNFVIINGVNSNTINGLGINELPPITKPEMRNIREEIDGRDGDITTNLGYSAYDKTITIGLFGTGYDINDIVAFFNGEGTIVFSNEPDKYYKYKILNQIDYESLQKFKTASITFHCQPFKYPLSETPLEIEYDYIEDEGETLTLNNTGNALMKLDLKGNTSQSGTPTPTSPIPVSVVSGDNDVVVCGKNLFNPITKIGDTNISLVNATLVMNGDEFELTATGADMYFGQVRPAGLAYDLVRGILIDVSNASYVRYTLTNNLFTNIHITAYDSNKISLGYTSFNTSSDTYTVPNNAKYISFRFGIGTATIGTTYKTKVQLEYGNTSTPYEPYTSQTYEVDLPVENIVNAMQESFTLPASATTYQKIISNTDTDNKVHLVANTKYYISYTIENASTSNTRSTPRLYLDSSNKYENTSTNRNITAGRKVDEYTPTTTGDYAFQYWLQGSNVAVVISDIMISTTKGSYQPYGTTPIELCKIGTYQDYFTKNSGKNLFNDNEISNIWVAANGTINYSATGSNAKLYEVQQGETYTLKATFSSLSSDNVGVIAFFDSSMTLLSREAIGNELTVLISKVAPTNAKYMYAGRFVGTPTTIQLEKGTSTPYEPYGTNQWCKYNAIGKVVLDGSESWATGNANRYYLVNYKDYFYKTGNSNMLDMMSDVAKKINDDTLINNPTSDYIIWVNWNGNIFFSCLNLTSIYTEEQWKSATAGHVIYGRLATPYLSLIEDNNLIEQLDNLENAMSYEGQTNITQVNNDKAFIISAKALEDGTNEVVVNNIGNVYSKPLIALEGSGNVDIYLDNTQILKANVEDKMNIDIAQLEAYNPDTMTLLNRQVIGNYNSMTLQPGNNTIRIDGALDKATITNYTRYL